MEYRLCQDLVYCRLCRQADELGNRFRQQYSMPDQCPYGNGLTVPPAESCGVICETSPEIRQQCLSCGDNKACCNVTVCCGGQMDVVVRGACKLGKFDLSAAQ
jgi:hypothetical protein